eukprot:TRINITY_DN8583_c0_g2_i1.p1 TRINITY_DN8583_c0_g2~~TRINITY_DN8583_c0_g2_i1.p1  ORF type:complete len:222 (+),score=15.80 TRINITY_DN8583_c0_g2_i1:295-960(+)
MGMLCSGELSDATFLHSAEEGFLTRPDIQLEYAIHWYYRFKDDIILFSSMTDTQLDTFKVQAQAHSPHFVLEFESCTKHMAVFLDISLYKGKAWASTGVLDYSPYRKPTSLWRPLADTSAHHARIHDAWPKAMINRYAERCSKVGRLRSFLKEWVEEFERAVPYHGCNHALRDSISTAMPKVAQGGDRALSARQETSSRLVLPFGGVYFIEVLPSCCKCGE